MTRLPIVVSVLLATTASAGFLDLFTWDLGSSLTGNVEANRRGEDTLTTVTKRNCNCVGSGCNCCVDFNLTFIDLGGPGCVRMNYISPTEGILVNVSYGDSQLHSETVKGANPEPTCMDILTDLAQVCARFSDLAPTSDGLRWCLQLEPTLLGEVQTQYQVGCFKMGPLGMTVDPPIVSNASYAVPAVPTPQPAVQEEEKPAVAAGTDEEPDTSDAALIAAVNESAEEGIAFFSNLLGLNFGGAEVKGNSTEEDDEEDATTTDATKVTSTPVGTEQRAGRSRFLVPRTSVNELV